MPAPGKQIADETPPNKSPVHSFSPLPPRQHFLRRQLAWMILAVASLFGVAVLLGIHYANPYFRSRAIALLQEKFHGDVELREFRVKVYPGIRIEGEGLMLRQEGRTDVPPIISVDEFSATAGLRAVVGKPWRIGYVHFRGLKITIPPKDPNLPPRKDWSKVKDIPVLIHELASEDATLTILPKSANKSPHVFEIHHLVMHEVGLHRPASFTVNLENATPPGSIDTKGSFGPWVPDDPGQTRLSADYTFVNADLGVFRGISGILASRGKFGGVLDEIAVNGQTDTPDFRVSIAGHPVNLKTLFSATVDGTNGNTLLHPVRAQFLNTTIVAQGDIVKKMDAKGRTIELDVTIDKGRIEDLMRLAVKSNPPPLTGNVTLHAKLELPPGAGDLTERLNLTGRFGVRQAEFTSKNVSKKIQTLSRKGLGKPDESDAGSDISDLRGQFALDAGVLTFRGLIFQVEGAEVQLDGTYALRDEKLDFHGHLEMVAKVSQTMTGFKSLLLKAVDPFFRKGGKTVIPIKVTGTRDKPSFGLDLHHKEGE